MEHDHDHDHSEMEAILSDTSDSLAFDLWGTRLHEYTRMLADRLMLDLNAPESVENALVHELEDLPLDDLRTLGLSRTDPWERRAALVAYVDSVITPQRTPDILDDLWAAQPYLTVFPEP